MSACLQLARKAASNLPLRPCPMLNSQTWNPATDHHLAAHYTAEDLSGKRACKAALCSELGLPFDGVLESPAANGGSSASQQAAGPWGPNGRPLLAIVSRLTEQKGLPLMLAGLRAAIAAGAQVVVLGSAPEEKVRGAKGAVAPAKADRGPALNVRVHVGSDGRLKQWCYASRPLAGAARVGGAVPGAGVRRGCADRAPPRRRAEPPHLRGLRHAAGAFHVRAMRPNPSKCRACPASHASMVQ